MVLQDFEGRENAVEKGGVRGDTKKFRECRMGNT